MINDLIMTGWDWRSFSHRRPWREGQIRWCEKCEMMVSRVSRVSRVIMMDTSVSIHFNASSKLTTVFTAIIFPPLSSQPDYFYPTLPLADFITLSRQGLVARSEATHWVCVFRGDDIENVDNRGIINVVVCSVSYHSDGAYYCWSGHWLLVMKNSLSVVLVLTS